MNAHDEQEAPVPGPNPAAAGLAASPQDLERAGTPAESAAGTPTEAHAHAKPEPEAEGKEEGTDEDDGDTPYDYRDGPKFRHKALLVAIALSAAGAVLGYISVPAALRDSNTRTGAADLARVGFGATTLIGILVLIGVISCFALAWPLPGYGPKPEPKPLPLWLALLRLIGIWLLMFPFAELCLLLVAVGVDSAVDGSWGAAAILIPIGLVFGAGACVLLGRQRRNRRRGHQTGRQGTGSSPEVAMVAARPLDAGIVGATAHRPRGRVRCGGQVGSLLGDPDRRGWLVDRACRGRWRRDARRRLQRRLTRAMPSAPADQGDAFTAGRSGSR